MPTKEFLLTWSVFNTLSIVLLFMYLYKHERSSYIVMWVLGWCLYFVNQILIITNARYHNGYYMLFGIAASICGGISGVLFMWAVRRFTGHKLNIVWIYAASMFSIAGVVGSIFHINYLSNGIPNQIFLALVFLHMGMIAIRRQVKYGSRISLLGPVMILWAIHKLDYIVLYKNTEIVFWGYLLGLIFQYIVAFGVLFSFFNYTKLNLIKSERARRESEEKYRVLFEENNSAILLVDGQNGNIVDANPFACSLYGYAKEDFSLKNVTDIAIISKEEILCGFKQISSGEKYQKNVQSRLASGEVRDVEVYAGKIEVKDRPYVYMIIHDITERKRYEEKLTYLAYYDSLTELPNRKSLNMHFDKVLSYAQSHNRIIGVLFLDFDRFKNINDTLGHQIGDCLLKSIAKRLMDICGQDNTVVRLGGDEFIILIPGFQFKHEVEEFAGRLVSEFENPFTIEGNELYCTVSMGISLYPGDGEDMGELFKNADAAMYKAKDSGRNNYQFYSNDLESALHDSFYIANSFRNAFIKNEFYLCYQPKIEMKTGDVVGMEALVRWKHSKIGMIPPGKFIPIAEETGMIIPLGEWVLKTACRQNKEWIDRGINLVVAVNISARQFQHTDLYQTVISVLQETGLEPKYLELEITESIAIQNMHKVNEVLNKLRKMGVQVSMDDFGTGYSSLGYLNKIEIDTIKIDQSFIRDLTENPHNIQIAGAIIKIAHSLRLKVTAEGVETREHLNFLKEHNCDYMQGYYFSEPLPREEFEGFLGMPGRWKEAN